MRGYLIKNLLILKKMTTQINGWVIINNNLPNKRIIEETFSVTRSQAINKLVASYGETWLYWKKKYNFSAAKSVQTIDVTPH